MALAVNWSLCTLTLLLFFFLLINCSLSCLPTITHVSVSTYFAQPLYMHSYDLLTVVPSSKSLAMITLKAFLPSFSPNCPSFVVWLFILSPQDVTHYLISVWNDSNVKKACMQRDLMLFWIFIYPNSNISCLFLSYPFFLFGLKNRRHPKYQSSQLPHFLADIVSIWNPWWHCLIQAAVMPKLWKVSQNFFTVAMVINLSPSLTARLIKAACCGGQCRTSQQLLEAAVETEKNWSGVLMMASHV